MSVQVANATATLSGKTLVTAEDDVTITGQVTFSNAPGAPFDVTVGSAKVTNLDADKLDGVEGSAYAEVANTETISAVWTFSAAPVLNAKPSVNAGLQFPASQAASSDANCLDDYEEGSWTPVIGGSGGQSGQAYTTQLGRYVKIGKLVWVGFRAILSTRGTITGSVQIQGLPFTTDSTASFTPSVYLGFENTASTYSSIMGHLDVNATTMTVRGVGGTGGTQSTALVQADLGNTSQLLGQFCYLASA